MNGQAIIDKFELFVGDSLDPDFTLQLANDAMHEIDEEVRPEGLKKVSTSASTTVGQTYTTAISLPTDFFLPSSRIYVGTTPYTQVPFEKSVYYRDLSGYYYVDVANSQYHLCGTQTSVQTITFPYFYSPADITVSTSPAWPSQFHSLIPLRMAEMYFAIDGGEKARSWDDRFGLYYKQRLDRFKHYDASLKLAAIDNSTPYGETYEQGEDRINLD